MRPFRWSIGARVQVASAMRQQATATKAATPRDALCPLEAVGAVVEVEHERSCEQERRQRRNERRPQEQEVQAVEAQQKRADSAAAGRIDVSGASAEALVRVDRLHVK